MSALRKEGVVSDRPSAEVDRHLHESISIGPMRVTTLSRDELADRLVSHALHGGSTKHVVTANAQFYVLAERNSEFRHCVEGADYVCADGLPIVRLCQWLGGTMVERITGVDLIPMLCERAATWGLPIYLLGGNPGSAAASAALLMDRFPALRVAGVGCPPYGFESDPQVLAELLESIAVARPAMIFVALGAPKQEFFIQRYLRALNIPVAVGVGGSFEFIAGVRKRAPEWVQSAGLEWAFRFVQEPRRLARRYLIGNSVFSYYALRFLLGGGAEEQESGEPVLVEPSVDMTDPREREAG